jgi:hypothetical protein
MPPPRLYQHRHDRQGDEGPTSAAVVIRLATLDDDGPTGKFFNEHGELPW